MSIHKSLVTRNRLVRQRNVLTRLERIEILEREGKRQADSSVFALPKVRVQVAGRKGKAKKKAKKAEA